MPILPLLAGLAGFIGGVISTVIHNRLAAVASGIELQFEHPSNHAAE